MQKIYVAATTREADEVERVLREEGVEFTQKLDAVMREASGACFQGTAFEVDAADVVRCRRILSQRGLLDGLVAAD